MMHISLFLRPHPSIRNPSVIPDLLCLPALMQPMLSSHAQSSASCLSFSPAAQTRRQENSSRTAMTAVVSAVEKRMMENRIHGEKKERVDTKYTPIQAGKKAGQQEVPKSDSHPLFFARDFGCEFGGEIPSGMQMLSDLSLGVGRSAAAGLLYSRSIRDLMITHIQTVEHQSPNPESCPSSSPASDASPASCTHQQSVMFSLCVSPESRDQSTHSSASALFAGQTDSGLFLCVCLSARKDRGSRVTREKSIHFSPSSPLLLFCSHLSPSLTNSWTSGWTDKRKRAWGQEVCVTQEWLTEGKERD